MAKNVRPASFEDFLNAPSRLAKRAASADGSPAKPAPSPLPSRSATPPKARPKKEKVGLTLDPAIIEAVDDYIYHERKRGRRLKKNDVYEAALRQFLGIDGGEAI